MIEIIPNWHPVFVHFTIALLSMSVIFHLLKVIVPQHSQHQTALHLLAKTNLYIGVAFAIATATAGWFAYNSVNHDTPSHLAMTLHRDWALITLTLFIVLALWSLFRQHKTQLFFSVAMLLAGGLLATTGWLGAEAVYRYGLGVQSLPQSSGEGHAHQHAEGEGHGEAMKNIEKTLKPTTTEDHSKTPHEHTDKPIGEITDKAMPKTAKPATETSHDDTPHTH